MPPRETREALVAGAIAALKEDGFAGASARTIARRAGCNQALIFYHFGSVPDLLMAALEEVSAQRLAAYEELLAGKTGSVAELVDTARIIFEQDLDAGHVTVLAEMISGARSVPGLGERVRACLEPWRAFAAEAVRDVLAAAPISLPAEQAAHGLVAGILGLELLASLDADRSRAMELFAQARALGELLDRLGPITRLFNLGGDTR
jgi:AcrR family transcriptional regulator